MSITAEIMSSHFNLEFDASTQSFWIQDALGHKLSFSSQILSEQELADRVRPIWEHTKKHPAAMALLQESLGNGSISVVFKAQEDLHTIAAWYNLKREIWLLATVTDLYSLLDMFIFELNNSINKKIYECGGIMDFKSAEEYALQCETAEYETSERTVRILIDGLNQYNWPATTEDVVHRAHRTLEKYLSDVRCRGNHSGLSHFDSYKLAYCSSKIRVLDVTIIGHSSMMVTAEEEIVDLKEFVEDLQGLTDEESMVNLKNLAENIQEHTATYEASKATVQVAQKEKMELIRQKEVIENDAKNRKERQDKEHQDLEKLFKEMQKKIEQYNLENNQLHAYLIKFRGLARPLTFMKTRESAIYQQKWALEDKGQNDRSNYKKYGFGFGAPGVVDAP